MDRATRSQSHAPEGHPPTPCDHKASAGRTEPSTDFVRVGKNAVAGSVALGGCFGSMTALNNAVRATPGVPRAVRVVTGVLPSAGVFPTPWVENGVRDTLGTSATLPRQPTLGHDTVAAASLFLFNVGFSRSGLLPRYGAATPRGMAVTVLQCASASLVAGAATELTAQWMNAQAQDKDAACEGPPPVHFDNTDVATGRLLSQLPAAGLQTGLALSGKQLPSRWSLLPLGLVTGGWSFRRVLMPGSGSAQVSEPRAPSTPWIPDCTIPPA